MEFQTDQLLGRPPIAVANEQILAFVQNKIVAVTGGGGSIGAELCRQIAARAPKSLIVIDIYENNAYAIQQELRTIYGDALDLQVYIASVRDAARMEALFTRARPELVLHAAAHKHVPLMEDSPEEAVKNNIFGTWNTAQAAVRAGVERFVLISTDKAVNPASIMGATKRVCERIVQHFSQTTDSVFASVRFGNVLGSNGSVIPLFAEHIRRRLPITITDPRMTRYFMTTSEATQLVLSAAAMAVGGETFVLDMGEPVNIDALARRMIALAGLRAGEDVEIRYTGLRPGEKLSEARLTDMPGLEATACPFIFAGREAAPDADAFFAELDRLQVLAAQPEVSRAEIAAALQTIVPEFCRKRA